MAENCVIIGNGCAAMECIKSARENGYQGEITLMSDVLQPSYNPMLDTYFATGKMDYDALFPYGNDLNFYTKRDVRLYLGAPVISLDTEKQVIENTKGLKVNYDQCLIASGASPIVPGPFKGVLEYVYTLRTIEDGVKFRKLLKGEKKRVLVVGASMVGIKAVEALIENGFSVCLVDFVKYIFPLAAHRNCSLMIHEILEEKDVKLRFGMAVDRVEAEDDHLTVYFTDSVETEDVDCIIMCVGVRANTSFIDSNQIAMDKGILVNDYMESSKKGVFSAGDVAQGNDIMSGEKKIIGLWANARLQGRTAGANIAGKKEKYHGTLPHNITHFLNHDFIGIGNILNGDDMYEEMDLDNNKYCCFVWKEKKLIGINILNIPEISGLLKNCIVKGLVCNPDRGLSGLANNNLAMNKLYNKYPRLEKKFMEMR